MKKVSVIIPAFNKVDLTIRTIESIFAQTYKNIEIIVVDDGSTDDTQNRLQLFGDKITYIRKQNGGASSARNVGVKKASGDYIALIDCDDIYYPEKISKSVECLEADNSLGFVYTGANFIDDNDDVISEHGVLSFPPSGWIAFELVFENFICNSTVVVRKECFETVGYFDEKIFIPADWDMWLRISEKYKAAYIDERLTGYRLTQCYTGSNIAQGISETIYVFDKAYRRNSKMSNKMRKRFLANIYFSYGLSYAVAEHFEESTATLKKGIRIMPHCLKAIFFYGGILVAPQLFRKIILHFSPNRNYLILKSSK